MHAHAKAFIAAGLVPLPLRGKALAKTKTLDDLIAMGVNHAIDRAVDEAAPHEPISPERIDAIMQRAKET